MEKNKERLTIRGVTSWGKKGHYYPRLNLTLTRQVGGHFPQKVRIPMTRTGAEESGK